MKHINLSYINLQTIEYFIAIAEMGNITHASYQLNISQSTLSQKLARLEDAVGLKLFERGRHGVTLTTGGKYLYDMWSKLIKSMDYSLDTALKLSEECPIELRIGLSCGTAPYNFAEKIFQGLPKADKRYHPVIRYGASSELINDLVNKEFDIIAVVAYNTFENYKEISTKEIDHIPMAITMSYQNPALNLTKPDLYEFRDQTFLIASDRNPSFYSQMLFYYAKLHGFTPNITLVPNTETLLFMIRTNQGISLSTLQYRKHSDLNCAIAVLQDKPIPFILAWHKNAPEYITASLPIIENIYYSIL